MKIFVYTATLVVLFLLPGGFLVAIMKEGLRQQPLYGEDIRTFYRAEKEHTINSIVGYLKIMGLLYAFVVIIDCATM